MKKLTIINIDNYEYTLRDNNNLNYNLNLEFQNIDIKPKTGDCIYMSDELLNKNYQEYSNTYTFGPLGSFYGRTITNENNPDIIKLQIDNESLYLQRYYG